MFNIVLCKTQTLIRNYMVEQNLVNESHYGFVKDQSCLTNWFRLWKKLQS